MAGLAHAQHHDAPSAGEHETAGPFETLIQALRQGLDGLCLGFQYGPAQGAQTLALAGVYARD
jgi:hypothetical protein